MLLHYVSQITWCDNNCQELGGSDSELICATYKNYGITWWKKQLKRPM